MSTETQAEAGQAQIWQRRKWQNPYLVQTGKNKWFGSQEKAQAFIDKKKLGNDYQVVQDGKRFEIQPKVQVPVQDKTAPVTSSGASENFRPGNRPRQ